MQDSSLGSAFLHERNSNFHNSLEVTEALKYLKKKGKSVPNEPIAKITAYIELLQKGEFGGNGILAKTDVRSQVSQYIIKAKDIPDGYFELQRRIHREQGKGELEITPEHRREAFRVISKDQRHSLTPWAKYLASDDVDYPAWFTLYVFDSVTRMGKFDQEKGEFTKRTGHTVAPFPGLSRGALAQIYSWIKVVKIDKQAVTGVYEDTDKEAKFQSILKGGNFARLYAQALVVIQDGAITSDQKSKTEGSWRQYLQGSNPKKLHGDLQGFGLDWCTATGFETASSQLKTGDFYVYYTQDEKGQDSIPRIAVRMEYEDVAEVRGINPSQELEPEMTDIAVNRLKTLPGGEVYIRNADDMKRLKRLGEEVAANSQVVLSDSDLRFLYQVDRDIRGFGFEPDPRIAETRMLRGQKDKTRLKRLLPQMIQGQAENSYEAYKNVAAQLEAPVITLAEFEEVMDVKYAQWEEASTYEYLLNRLIEDGARYKLVVVPNIETPVAQIIALAQTFGKDQPVRTTIKAGMYINGVYSPRDLSGYISRAGVVRVILIPTSYDAEISIIPDSTSHIEQLADRRKKYPDLHIRVPSILEAISFWYTLRAGGDSLTEDSAQAQTGIFHFEMKSKFIDGWESVPYTTARHRLHNDPTLSAMDPNVFIDTPLRFGIG